MNGEREADAMNEDLHWVRHYGGCHCGQVRFSVDAPAKLVVQNCNCSICSKSGLLHLIVPKAQFQLLSGADHLISYSWNSGIAKHLFCRTCGIKSFYIPRSNPDGIDVNARCLDAGTVVSMTIEEFDGQNWEANASSLAGLSAPSSNKPSN